MRIIDCKAIRKQILNEAQTVTRALYKANGQKLTLVVVSVGEDPASQVYIRNKLKACEEAGIECNHVKLSGDIQYDELAEILIQYGQDTNTTALMLQLPIPDHLKPYQQKLLNLVPWFKDVDGLCSDNIARLYTKECGLVPCTAIGCMKILESTQLDLTGLNAVVCGRSALIGRPIVQLLLNANCTVTTAHSKTQNLKELTKRADIVICAIGKAKYFDRSYFKNDAIVLDVGMNRDENGKLCGDINLESLQDTNIMVTPTPGGTGVMTVGSLILNIIKAGGIQCEEEN